MKSIATAARVVCGIAFLSLVGWVNHAQAQWAVGTIWIRTDAGGKGITMSISACCNGGYRLTYQIPAMGGQPATVMTIDSPLDGTDVPALLGGKPSGQTMALKRVDDRHYTALMKMHGQPLATARGAVSADGKSMTVETVPQGGGNGVTIIETWVRK